MLVAGLLLGVVAIGRCIIGAVMLAVTFTGNPFRATTAAVGVVALASSVAYLIWLAVRGKHDLHVTPAPRRSRDIVVTYALLALLILPALEWLLSR